MEPKLVLGKTSMYFTYNIQHSTVHSDINGHTEEYRDSFRFNFVECQTEFSVKYNFYNSILKSSQGYDCEVCTMSCMRLYFNRSKYC